MRTSIWLLRHGQTEANRARRYQGRSDSPLTPYGQQQHAALVQRLRPLPFSLALSSPSERALCLANEVAISRSLTVQRMPGLGETDHGMWEGLTYREVLQRFPQQASARWADGLHGRAVGGESLAETIARVRNVWEQLLHHARGERIVVATHATPIRIVLCLALGLDLRNHWQWRIDLGSVTCLDVYPTGAIVRMINEVPRFHGQRPLPHEPES